MGLTPQTKGKVERPIRYVRQSFVYGREFVSDGDLDHQRIAWLSDVANARVHQTTKEVPALRFGRDEHALLRPLATRSYQSLILTPTAIPTPASSTISLSPSSSPVMITAVSRELALPRIDVEQRSLKAYASLAARLAGAAR